jgi:hypothetical protein
LRSRKASPEPPDRLNVTQSAVSHQLRELEGRLGTPLFVRSATCVHTMSAGASVMLLTNYCTRSTLARPESGPARWIDDDRHGGTVQVVARPPGAIRCKAPQQ